MCALEVSLAKLKKYIEQQGGYDLEESGQRITLSFVPAFPEALEKSWDDNPPPRIVMHGELTSEGKVAFRKFEMEEDHRFLAKDPQSSELTYRAWLEFIEQNY